MISRYVLASFLATIWASGLLLATLAMLGILLERDDRGADVRSAKGVRRARGKPRPK